MAEDLVVEKHHVHHGKKVCTMELATLGLCWLSRFASWVCTSHAAVLLEDPLSLQIVLVF